MIEYFDYDVLERATERFSPARLIGKGSHGSVYTARLPNDTLVAVKTPLNGNNNSNNDSSFKLQNEIRILSSLRRNSHVIAFLGTCFHHHPPLLVMEFMPNGSLHHLLHVSKTPPSWPQRLQILTDVARAIRFLHDESQPSIVIHRDIKSDNVLLDAGLGARLADFGLAVAMSRHVDSPPPPPGPPAGTIGYMDPRYTTAEKLSPKNDAFSFGVLALEIVSGRKVMDLSRDPAGIVDWAVPLIRERRVAEVCDGRVSLPADVAGAVRRLLLVAASCVSLDEDCRPAMSDVVSALECRFLERARFRRFPVWMNLLLVVFMRRRRKMAKQRSVVQCGSNKKMLLREILL